MVAVTGDALEAASLKRALAGQDAVIYALGVRADSPPDLFSRSTRLLIGLMKSLHVNRLIAVTGIGAGDSKGHGGRLYEWLIYPLFTHKIYADKDRQEQLIQESDLEWTIVRPSSFVRHGNGKIRAETNLEGVTISSISREDTARFLVDELETSQYAGQAPLIGY